MKALLAILILFLSGCNFFESDEQKIAREAAELIEQQEAENKARKDGVENFVNENLKDPSLKNEIESEFKRALTQDPTEDSGENLALRPDDEKYVQQGKDLGLLKDAKNAEEAAREIGKLGAGLLNGKTTKFSSKPDFRCTGVVDNPTEKNTPQVIAAKAVHGSVAYVRYKNHSGFSPNGVSDFVCSQKVDAASVTYTSALTDDSNNQIVFTVNGSLDSEKGTSSTASLRGTINGQDINLDFKCIKGE